MNFGMPAQGGGVQADEDEAFRIMDRGLDSGELLRHRRRVRRRARTHRVDRGPLVPQGDRRRERVVNRPRTTTRSSSPNDGQLSALRIRQACEDSFGG